MKRVLYTDVPESVRTEIRIIRRNIRVIDYKMEKEVGKLNYKLVTIGEGRFMFMVDEKCRKMKKWSLFEDERNYILVVGVWKEKVCAVVLHLKKSYATPYPAGGGYNLICPGCGRMFDEDEIVFQECNFCNNGK